MNIVKSSLAIAIISVLSCYSTASSQESLIVTLKDFTDVKLLPDLKEEASRQAILDQARKEVRDEFVVRRKQVADEMRIKGYALTTASVIGQRLNPYRFSNSWTRDPDSVALNFSPRLLPSFGDEYLVGTVVDKKSPSEYARVYQYEDLGIVIVEEYHYISDKSERRVSISRPAGPLEINGHKVDYLVFKASDDRDLELTYIRFYTSERLYTVSLTKAIPLDDPRYDKLLGMLDDLY